MRFAVSYLSLLIICGSGCGVSQSDFDAVQQRRIAAEREATKAQADHDKLKKQIEDAEAEKKKWRETAVDLSDSLARIIGDASAFENLRIRFGGKVNPTSIFLSRLSNNLDLNGPKLYCIHLTNAQSGDLPTFFFVLSEVMRDELMSRGSSAGFALLGKGNAQPAWDARLFFVVLGTGKRDPSNGAKEELYGQLYRIELFKSPNLSGEPAVVVEDEELIANPNPPPPTP